MKNQQTRRPRTGVPAWTLIIGVIGLMAAFAGTVRAEAKKTGFTSQSIFIGLPAGGTMVTDGVRMYAIDAGFQYQEVATDPRASGLATVRSSAVFDLPNSPGPLWGSIRIENADGAWAGFWTGRRTAITDPDGTSHLLTSNVMTAEGSGAYAGLVMRSTITGVDVANGNPLTSIGYIIEKKGGPGERPMSYRGIESGRFELHPGMYWPPSAPPQYGAMATFDILEEVGLGSHIGRSTNHGFGLVDIQTGRCSTGGFVVAANGDMLNWVLTGTYSLATSEVSIIVHWAGGTGRFEAAVGEWACATRMELVETGDPLVFMTDWSYNFTGTVRY